MSRKPRVQSKRPRRKKLADGDECGDNGALKMERMLSELRGLLTTATLLLVVFLLVAQVSSTAYGALGLETPPGFDLLYSFGMLYAIGYWLVVDNRKNNFRWPYCRGIFLQIAGFFIVPYYLFKTRGKYAFLILFIFICLYLAASLTGLIVTTFWIASGFD